MYEGFSGQARKAMQLAYDEAQRRRHDYVGTEHLLLAVLREGSAAVTKLLAAAGVEVEAVYRAVEALMPPAAGEVTWDQLPLTPGAKRALEDARREAAGLRHASIGPEDLLLGLLGDPESSAAQAVLPLGVTRERLREEAAKLPATENRDWLLRPEPTPGGPVRGDPTAGDIEAVVSAAVLPQRRTSTAIQKAPGRRRRRSERTDALLTDASLDLPVVEKQLRVLQFVVAIVGGSVVGARVVGVPGALFGFVVGCGLAATRNNLANAILGTAGGALYGLYSYPGQPPLCFLWALVGLAVGVCLGDWRALPAPPGSGQGPPTPDRATDPEEED
jgi:ATP-dependent Clp protease ATP-binding subunit ClpC